MKPSKKKKQQQWADSNRRLSDRSLTLHRRLHDALNLGLRGSDEGREWHSKGVDTQRLAVRSISAFLDGISAETMQHPAMKESVADIIKALEGILRLKNDAILSMAKHVAVKLVSTLPHSMLHTHISELVHPFSSLLSCHLSEVALSCAIALRIVLSKLNVKRENEVWSVLDETQAVRNIVHNMRDFPSRTKPLDYFKEMASLLGTILCRWPPARYYVWTDAELLKALWFILEEHDVSANVAIMQLYSSIALCGYGARKLLENGGTLVDTMVSWMDSSHPDLVRAEGFKLAQCLMMNEEECLKMMSMSCEPIIKAIVNAMSGWMTDTGKVSNDRMSLLVEACRLALVTRWGGEHHNYFWKLGVEKVLLGLLLGNLYGDIASQKLFPLEKQIEMAHENLKTTFLPVLRPYIWDILGWLAIHCEEESNPGKDGEELCFSMLVTFACVAFVDSMHKSRLVHQDDAKIACRSESACRAVLMMIYSPCKNIAAHTRSMLYRLLKLNGDDNLKYLINSLHSSVSGNIYGMSNTLQTSINLMGLTCYSGLPQYKKHVIRFGGIKTLMASMRSCLSTQDWVGRSRVAPHLVNTFIERKCCWNCTSDWEGRDIILLFSLWALAEMINVSVSETDDPDLFFGHTEYSKVQLINELQQICIDSFPPGVRWYAAYILCHFGTYGFPSKLGKRISAVLNEEEYADMQLMLADGKLLSVHGVILMARCPSLLPPGKLHPRVMTSDIYCKGSRIEVRLSVNVGYQPLLKLLEFVYLGYLLAEYDLVQKLKPLAKGCNLLPLYQLLRRRRPKWGTTFPRFTLQFALQPAGHNFSDIVVESKATDVMPSTCSLCSLSAPHLHLHKVILWSSCDYLRALFRSGMQESQSHLLRVPISWEALNKLVHWFYVDELPKPVSGCIWDNMESEDKLHQLLPYIELCWLAECWLLSDVQEGSLRVIENCLDSARHLSIRVMQTAVKLSQWKLVEIAANYLAPSYSQLRDSGDLEALDEELVDIIRAASIRLLSQDSCDRSLIWQT